VEKTLVPVRQRRIDIIEMVFRETDSDSFVRTTLDFIGKQSFVSNNVPSGTNITDLSLFSSLPIISRSHIFYCVMTLTHVNLHSYLT
jgi:hypothetical protein